MSRSSPVCHNFPFRLLVNLSAAPVSPRSHNCRRERERCRHFYRHSLFTAHSTCFTVPLSLLVVSSFSPLQHNPIRVSIFLSLFQFSTSFSISRHLGYRSRPLKSAMAIICRAFKRASFTVLQAMDFVEGFLIDERANGEERKRTRTSASLVKGGIFHEDGRTTANVRAR